MCGKIFRPNGYILGRTKLLLWLKEAAYGYKDPIFYILVTFSFFGEHLLFSLKNMRAHNIQNNTNHNLLLLGCKCNDLLFWAPFFKNKIVKLIFFFMLPLDYSIVLARFFILKGLKGLIGTDLKSTQQ